MFDVRVFTEKPDEETAKRFLSTGEFLWNSALYGRLRILRLPWHRTCLKLRCILQGMQSWHNANTYAINYGVLRRIYAQCANISIDYGIMEK